jgi:hypothetical protein
MSSLPTEAHSARALAVTVSGDRLTVELTDGRTVAVPFNWYPRLAHATAGERANFRLIGAGEGIRWPDLDEDVSIASLLAGRRSQESGASFERWLQSRKPAG